MVAVLAPRPHGSGPAAPSRFVPRLVPPTGDPRPTRRHSAEVYRRRRIVALAVLVVVLVGAGVLVRGWLGGTSEAGAAPAGRAAAGRVWVVRPGDTLWGIALASGDKGDVRPLVDALSAEVHGQPLQIGQRLLLP
jgi:hypothetical protein